MSTAGREVRDWSWDPTISADGRLVAFVSTASRLVPGDTNVDVEGDDEEGIFEESPAADVFVRDLPRERTERVSVSSRGEQGEQSSLDAAISGNGRYVAFASHAGNLVRDDANRHVDVFVRDLHRDTTRLVSTDLHGKPKDGDSEMPTISPNGRYVAFASEASDLVRGDTNGKSDVFLRDMRRGTTRRVSVASDGTESNDATYEARVSDNGRFVVFISRASNLVKGDTNGGPVTGDTTVFGDDVFVHDISRRTTKRVNVSADGAQADHDSVGQPAISGSGRYVSFASRAQNLVSGNDRNGSDSDVFVRDMQRQTLRRVSVSTRGAQASDWSDSPVFSPDGRFLAFASAGTNLVRGDRNGVYDVFVRGPGF